MNIEAYLERINYRGSLLPSAKTLRDLQLAHLVAVPFENLSIHWGEPIVLTDEALFEKIVERRRGGFCYELNGLFAVLLRNLGFEVAMLSAGVADDGGVFSPAFDHMTLLVSLDERWLVDVGFGDTFREPLRLEMGMEQAQNGRVYRIDADGQWWTLMEFKNGGEGRAQYRFDLQSYHFGDYVERCRYHQTSPESHFTQKRICSRATQTGRLTLSRNRFITALLSGDRQERVIEGEDEVTQILEEHFGMVR